MLESDRLREAQTPIIPIIMDMVRAHPGTISLGQGVASYGPPRAAIEAARAFGDEPESHNYKAVEGIPPLLDAIGEKLATDNNICLRDQRIVVTAGANMAFVNAILALTDPGDEIILQTPYYFNYEMAVGIAGCRAVCVQTDNAYQLRPQAIREAITSRTRAIVTISPNNPTGAVYPAVALRAVNAISRDAGVAHIHDEAYEYFVYGDVKRFSPGSIEDSQSNTISIYSLSKSYGFASWRIGYMVIPEHLFTAIQKIQDTILICPPVVSQHAALAALRVGSDYCKEKLEATARVRDLALCEFEAVDDILTVPPADGAFYFLLQLATKREPLELAERLIREHGVAVIPGTAFGATDGCTLRVAYGALEEDSAVEGIRRLVRGLRASVTD